MKLQLQSKLESSQLGAHLLRHSSVWICTLLFALSFWLLSLRMYVPLEWGDEGYFANAALRILDGEMIYRDFQHNYPPGRMYALAFLIKLFGHDLSVVRLFWVFCHSASVVVGYCVSRRLMPSPLALVVALAILFNDVHQNKTVELLVSSLLLLTLFRVLERRTSDLIAGVAMGALAYFRHDVAMMGFMLFYLQMFAQAYTSKGDAPYLARLRNRGAEGSRFLLAFALTGLPFVFYLLFQDALAQAFSDLTLAGFEANAALSKPFPPLFDGWGLSAIWQGLRGDSVVFYTPPFVYAVMATVALRSLRSGDRSLKTLEILVCAGFGILVFAQVIPRTDMGHLSKAYIPAHILTFALLYQIGAAGVSNFGRRRLGRAVLCAVLVVLVATLPIKLFLRHGEKYEALPRVLATELFGIGTPFLMVEFPHGRFKMRSRSVAARMRATSARILETRDQGMDESMLVYPAGAIFNFLYGYKSPVAYDVLRPGELGGNAPEIIEEIEREIARVRPTVLIWVSEGTNRELARSLNSWARDSGYQRRRAPRMDVWIRSDP